MFQDFIDKHKDEMIHSLQVLLQIPSVKEPAEIGHPFGHGPSRALEYMLSLAAEKGFTVKNVDGYAGHVEYGEGEDYVGVLSHLDVVPTGSGWTYPPFAAEIHEGKVYARGAIDDKGPAMSSLWSLIALKDAGVVPKRKIRLIFGLDEENDWKCMDYYFQHESLPLGGFTPDADFPMIYAEKGLATLRLGMKADVDSMSPRVVQFEGGSRVNVVPDYAYAVVDCHSETAAREWEQQLYKDAKQKQVDMDVSLNGSRLQIVVRGKAAHASRPELGVNAIVRLASLLACHSVSNASMWRAIANQDPYGKALGIEASDETTGALTSNLGMARLDNNAYAFFFNIRYPIDLNKDNLLSRCKEYVSDKWSVTVTENLPPHFVPLDSAVVHALRKVYIEKTGDESEPMAIGGATYARAIPNAVAFGPLFSGQPELAHQEDEHWALDDYFKCIDIYAHAMLELANTL